VELSRYCRQRTIDTPLRHITISEEFAAAVSRGTVAPTVDSFAMGLQLLARFDWLP
jgi:hypothetical protein